MFCTLTPYYRCPHVLRVDGSRRHGAFAKDNIMVASDGYLKLIDFGMAKKLPVSGRTFTLCGTPEFCAPEVIKVVTQGFSEGYDTSIDF